MRPVAPSVVNLDSVRAELAYLEQLNTLRAGVLPDVPYNDRTRVVDMFEEGDFSIVHFAAHGTFDALSPDNSGISLTGGPFRPSDVFARFGGVRPRPLVFMSMLWLIHAIPPDSEYTVSPGSSSIRTA